MRLSDFIRNNREPIRAEWEAFARELKPSAELSDLALTDHIDDILSFIADDIETPQTAKEKFDKSRGLDTPEAGDTAAQIHGALRHEAGFDIVEMVSEYRALRATITKLWHRSIGGDTGHGREDLERLNEAVDQAVAESILRFTQDVEKGKNQLLAVMGHDIRSPMAAIQMASTLMPRFGLLTERQQKLLGQIESSAERVDKIVGDLLDLAKTSVAGQALPVRRASCSITDICRNIVDETRTRNPSRVFKLDVPDQCQGQWDEVRLGQMLSNLLSNAVQYGAAQAPITTKLVDFGDEIVLSVHNEGEPISPIDCEAIFKSFTRLSKGKSPGEAASANLGLGLFISKEIAVAHDGTISVDSSRDKGTTFTATLPKAPTDEKASKLPGRTTV